MGAQVASAKVPRGQNTGRPGASRRLSPPQPTHHSAHARAPSRGTPCHSRGHHPRAQAGACSLTCVQNGPIKTDNGHWSRVPNRPIINGAGGRWSCALRGPIRTGKGMPFHDWPRWRSFWPIDGARRRDISQRTWKCGSRGAGFTGAPGKWGTGELCPTSPLCSELWSHLGPAAQAVGRGVHEPGFPPNTCPHAHCMWSRQEQGFLGRRTRCFPRPS